MSKAQQQALVENPQIDDIDWGSIEGGNTDFSIQYPRMQWVHGNKAAAGFMKKGGLFISTEEYPNFTAEGFEPAVFIPNEGDEISGMGTSAAKLAVIRVKHQWVKEDNKNVPLAHVLCVVKGCEDLICIAMKGASKSKEFQAAFNQHMSQNVSVANRTRPAGVPALEPYALWFPIKAGDYSSATSKDGSKKSTVTFPELIAPETIDRAYVTSLWVGSENYKKFVSYWKDTKEWQNHPIREQRDSELTDADLSGMTGGDNPDGPAPESLLEHLVNLCMAKGQDLKQIAETYTNGATNQIRNLTAAECRHAIDDLKGL